MSSDVVVVSDSSRVLACVLFHIHKLIFFFVSTLVVTVIFVAILFCTLFHYHLAVHLLNHVRQNVYALGTLAAVTVHASTSASNASRTA